MYLMNATFEVQSFKALGNWFTLKPKQVKMFEDSLGRWIAEHRQDLGIVALVNEQDEDGNPMPPSKDEIARAETVGIDNHVKFLRGLIYNNQVSLRHDLELGDFKTDPAVLASEGELKAMELIAKYQDKDKDKEQEKIDRVKELMKAAGPAMIKKG